MKKVMIACMFAASFVACTEKEQLIIENGSVIQSGEVWEGKNSPCLNETIDQFLANSSCSQGRKVERYFFQGMYAYVLSENDCGDDFTSTVIDEQCNILGYLGGIAGNEMINGENFFNAQFIQVIYQD